MQWHQLDHMQAICASPQTDIHTSTPSLNFYRLDALPDAQGAVSSLCPDAAYANSISLPIYPYMPATCQLLCTMQQSINVLTSLADRRIDTGPFHRLCSAVPKIRLAVADSESFVSPHHGVASRDYGYSNSVY